MAKKFIGVIVSIKVNDAVVISVDRTLRHPQYHKVIRRRTKYMADSKGMEGLVLGDKVEVVEIRPISKNKCFKVVKKI